MNSGEEPFVTGSCSLCMFPSHVWCSLRRFSTARHGFVTRDGSM